MWAESNLDLGQRGALSVHATPLCLVLSGFQLGLSETLQFAVACSPHSSVTSIPGKAQQAATPLTTHAKK